MTRRRPLWILLALLALLIALALTAYAARLSLAEYALRRALEDQGVEVASLRVREISLHSAVLEEVSLGDKAALSAGRIALTFSFPEGPLLPRTIDLEKIVLEKLNVTFDLRPGQQAIAALAPLSGKDAETKTRDEGFFTYDPLRDRVEIELRDSSLTLLTEAGPIAAALNSDVSRDPDGATILHLSGVGEGAGGQASGSLSAHLEGEEIVQIRGQLTLSDTALFKSSIAAGEIDFDLTPSSLALAGDVTSSQGAISGFLFLESEEVLFSQDTPPLNPAALRDILEQRNWNLQSSWQVTDLSVPELFEGLSGHGALNLRKDGGNYDFALPENLQVNLTGAREVLPSDLRERLPQELLVYLEHPLELRAEAQSKGRAAVGADGIELDLTFGLEALSALGTSLTSKQISYLLYNFNNSSYLIETYGNSKLRDLPESEVKTGSAGLSGYARMTPEMQSFEGELTSLEWHYRLDETGLRLAGTTAPLTLELSDTGTLQAALGEGLQAEVSGLPQLAGQTVEVALKSLSLDLPINAPETATGSARAALLTEKLNLNGQELRQGGLEATITSTEAGSYRLEAEAVRLSFPGAAVAAAEPRLLLTWAPESKEAEIRIAGLSDSSGQARFPSLSADLTANLADLADIPLQGQLTGLGGRLKASMTGKYRQADDRLSFSAEMAPLLFVPGGIHPKQLHPLLAEMSDVQAELRANAKATLSAGRIVASSGVLSLKNANFTTPLGRYEGLDSEVTLTSLWPPRTEASQHVTAQRVIIEEIPLTDLDARFLLVEPEDPELSAGLLPDILIEEARIGFGQGRFRVRDARIRPLSENQDTVLEVEALELKDLFDLADIEDVTGRGKISGSIPLSLRGDAVAIHYALLEAEGPGVLNINSAEADAALNQGGDYVAMVLDALRDFRFDSLSIGVNKPLEGETLVTMKILGSNPQVLDGYPFDINLNLETNLGPVLRALREAGALRRELERQIREQAQ